MSLLLEAKQISKAYPGVQALRQVDLAVAAGEVLALVGENGAGKSTLMKILAGIETPDRGQLFWRGQPLRLGSVHAAEQRGIVLIHQELNLAENLDVASNLFLGREPTWAWPLQLIRRGVYRDAAAITQKLGLNVSPRRLVGDLPMGQQQLVEIGRALSLHSKLLIMDEPTSSLTQRETDRLFEVIRNLRQQGVAMIYISHRLKEVERLADRVVVLRDGQNVGGLSREEIRSEAMVRLMVGRDLQQLHQRQHRPAAASAPNRPLLNVQNLSWSSSQPRGVSFRVRHGEIVGLAGLIGAGRSELAETLFGIRKARTGLVEMEGRVLRIRQPSDALREGIFLVPEDRRQQGLWLDESVKFNVSLSSLKKLRQWGLISLKKEAASVQAMVDRLRIRTPSLTKRVGLLSGGNQQKVVLSKGLMRQPKLFLLDEPTRGVDVGAKAEIYSLMDEWVGQGVGILMISSDLEEILGMSDRVLVMHEGRLVGELGPDRMTEEAIMRLATGGL